MTRVMLEYREIQLVAVAGDADVCIEVNASEVLDYSFGERWVGAFVGFLSPDGTEGDAK